MGWGKEREETSLEGSNFMKWNYRWCELTQLHAYWEQISATLQEQFVLLTAESSLQPHFCSILTIYFVNKFLLSVQYRFSESPCAKLCFLSSVIGASLLQEQEVSQTKPHFWIYSELLLCTIPSLTLILKLASPLF